MATYKDYQPLQPGDLDVHDYRESLTTFASELAALSFSGAGTLTAPGEAARDALAACVAHAAETDRLVVKPRFTARLDAINREANARAVDIVGSLDAMAMPDTEQEARYRIEVEAQHYRQRLIRRTIIEIVSEHGDRGSIQARAAVDSLKAFEVAIEDFAGDPAELAVAATAQVVLDSVCAGLCIRAQAVPNAERGQASPDWLALSLWTGR